MTTAPKFPASKSLAFLILVGLSTAAHAANYSWIGTTGNWNTPANWSGGALPTSADNVRIENSGTALLPVGVSSAYNTLYIFGIPGGGGGLSISGGVLAGNSAGIGGDSSLSRAVVSSGTWTNSAEFLVGVTGTASLAISGGLVSAGQTMLGRYSNGRGTASLTSGTWNMGSTFIGYLGRGSITITGGRITSAGAMIGFNNSVTQSFVTISGPNSSWENSDFLEVGSYGFQNGMIVDGGGTVSNTKATIGVAQTSSNNFVSVTGSSSTWTNSGILSIGQAGARNSLLIADGGMVTSTIGIIGVAQSSSNNFVSVTGAGSTWANSGILLLGENGVGGSLSISDGGTVTSTGGLIGRGSSSNTHGSDNSVLITGEGSTWINSGSLTVGRFGSNNLLTVEDGALLKIGDAAGETIFFSTNGGAGNFLRIDDGYIALFGDQTAYVGSLITAGYLQLWDGSAWVTATTQDLAITYYANDAAGEASAEERTGYDGLGNYTVVSTVPEPTAATLILLGAAALLRRRARARR